MFHRRLLFLFQLVSGQYQIAVHYRLYPTGVSVSSFSTSNLKSTPGIVGRKNGADLGAFGGSFGLLRCCEKKMVSFSPQGGVRW